ncbi:ABC transporter ATP-binding protein [Candidatus Saccharibacteria bacterium CG10_big_fil_rev_8_21_14_0_10_47_8]|nr:MAG: ABC transporter ATP-binding protein [Candidatus Saccharibacteria bacterium CG10_big_fil_rev_8_21_14_0_10_47_8]
MDDIAIGVDNVSKLFKLPHEKNASIKSSTINFYKRNKSYELQQALKDISFEVKKGEFFGIVGRNGSGKSTLLKILAGIYSPTRGSISVNGTLTPFIELGVGFNPELTGRENVYLNGALLGFSRKEMQAMYDDIVEFAELEKFMDQKLKNYSSGMQVRLAFSIAIRAQSDILLIDEVLAVGDAIFQKKCYDYFKELKKNKRTVIFVSHDTTALQEYCDRGILLDGGELVEKGKIGRVARDYIDLLNASEEKAEKKKEDIVNQDKKQEPPKRWGTRDIEVISAETLDSREFSQKKIFTDRDKSITLRVIYRAKEKKDSPVYGITIYDSAGENIFQSNSMWLREQTSEITPGLEVEVIWDIPNIFNSGSFTASPAVADKAGSVIYDWRDELATFKVRKTLQSAAFANVAHTMRIKNKGENND